MTASITSFPSPAGEGVPRSTASTASSGASGTVAVIGLGLIGGSLARDLTARGMCVLGHDSDPETLRAAVDAGAVHAALGPDLRGVAAADVVVIATPVDEAPAVLAGLSRHPLAARLVTDVGSTKRSIVAAATALGLGDRFVGSHPLAGDHRWGWSASRRDLFVGAHVYLCGVDGQGEPASGSTLDAGDGVMVLAREFWELLGASVERCDAAVHDEMLAWSSHLPQVAATALALVLRQSGVERERLGPGGRDSTRLAGSSPELWTAIASDNAGAIAAALEKLELQLGELRGVLLAGDRERLRTRFATARGWFAPGAGDAAVAREPSPVS